MAAQANAAAGPRVEFARRPSGPLPGDVLAALSYGAPHGPDPRILQTGILPADGPAAMELWRVPGAAATGIDGPVRFAAHRDFLFAILDLEERLHGGVAGAAEAAYAGMREFQARRPQAHVLRIWNFLDDINAGEGDDERYRQFCVGRAKGLGGLPQESLPAATAVGRRRPSGRLQVCWLAGREPGCPVENPRQMRAYRYPREYGPSPPAFARATRFPTGELAGSGTSSIVGHESRHAGDLEAQVGETLENLRALHRAGGGAGAPTGVKVYLRDRERSPAIAAKVDAWLAGREAPLLLEADICRRELLVEMECLWV
jgi:chorismate lyase / 3-hydroxybenzoate synthase